MAEIVLMPKMNLVMEEGYLGQWYKSVGDVIALHDPLCSVENEKETGDVAALGAGVLLKIWGEEGETYPINTPIALIGEPNEDISEISARIEAGLSGQDDRNIENPSAIAEESAPIVEEPMIAESPKGSTTKVKMLPKLRKMIQHKGIDLEELIAYIGKDRVTEKDILDFERAVSTSVASAPGVDKSPTEPTPASSSGDRRERMSSMRRTIAANMVRSRDITASLTNVTEVDMTDALKMKKTWEEDGQKLSVTALIIKACAVALGEHEIINSSLDGEEIVFHANVNIGCAIDVPNGLVVPVIQQADKKSVDMISSEIYEFANLAKSGKLSNADMTGGTFTVTSVGMLGVEMFTPIINYPQAAIIGVGAITRLPRYLDADSEIPIPRHIMKLSLSYDHRIIDGAVAARFSLRVRELLENPILQS